jgi:hypothetical protein
LAVGAVTEASRIIGFQGPTAARNGYVTWTPSD